MKKFRFLLILLCFCMLLPIAACGKDEPQNEVPDDKYYYDDSSRERAADSIPEGYDLENQTITFFIRYPKHAEVVGDSESTDIIYSKIHERNLTVTERLNVKLEYIASATADMVPELKKERAGISGGKRAA